MGNLLTVYYFSVLAEMELSQNVKVQLHLVIMEITLKCIVNKQNCSVKHEGGAEYQNGPFMRRGGFQTAVDNVGNLKPLIITVL